MIFTDEFIDYWGDHFVANRIRERLGITFGQFLDGFRFTEVARRHHVICRGRLMGLAELKRRAEQLPAQQRIVEREIERLPRRNGRAIEKLKHHRHPVSTANFGAHQEKHK